MAAASPALAARSSGVVPMVSSDPRRDPRRAAIRRKQLQLRIRVGAGVEQQLDQLQAGRVIQRGPVGRPP